MKSTLADIWTSLRTDAEREPPSKDVIIRVLGRTAIGVRAGVLLQDGSLVLFIQVTPGWKGLTSLPEWRGMTFKIVTRSFGAQSSQTNLQLRLETTEFESVFFSFCLDLVDALEGVTDSAARLHELEGCIATWDRFFEKCGPEGLPPMAQRGLFAELEWIREMIEAGTEISAVTTAWKGCERAYHDFDLGGQIVEVKSTLTKEPRSVRISNERQLDDRGLKSLHLFVLTLHTTDGGGVSLPEQVQSVRNMLSSSAAAKVRFERCLVTAGYLDSHADRYTTSFVCKKRELFKVDQQFPRIIDVPSGVGHLKYSVTVAACQASKADLDVYLKYVTGD